MGNLVRWMCRSPTRPGHRSAHVCLSTSESARSYAAAHASADAAPFLQKKCGWLHLGEWVATAAGKGEAVVRWTWHNQYSTTKIGRASCRERV